MGDEEPQLIKVSLYFQYSFIHTLYACNTSSKNENSISLCYVHRRLFNEKYKKKEGQALLFSIITSC